MSDKIKEKSEEIETEEVANEAEAVEAAPVKTKEDELEEKLKEQADKYLRLRAEYDNYQKRTQKEKEARYTDALIDVAAEILPIGDNLERALQAEVQSEEAQKFKEGVEMVFKQFNEVLSKLNVKPIQAVGEQFDPNLHNAVMHIEDEAIDDNTVVEEFMKGYIHNDCRVVRHSMVKVAN